MSTAVSSEAWAKLRDWASVAGRGRLLLSGSVAHVSLKTAVVSFVIHFASTQPAVLSKKTLTLVHVTIDKSLS